MQRISDAYKRELEQPVVGAAHLRVSLWLIDADAAATASVAEEGQAWWSAPRAALASQGAQNVSCATFEPGAVAGGRELLILPRPGARSGGGVCEPKR